MFFKSLGITFVRRLPVLQTYQIDKFRSDPWDRDLQVRDCFSENSLSLLIIFTALLMMLLVPSLIVPALRFRLSIISSYLIIGGMTSAISWVIVATIMAKLKLRQLIRLIERSDDGQIYLAAKDEYNSIERLARQSGAYYLYREQLKLLKQKVVDLWQIAIDNSGLVNQLYHKPDVEACECPQQDPAITEAITSACKRLDNELRPTLDSQQELRQLS